MSIVPVQSVWNGMAGSNRLGSSTQSLGKPSEGRMKFLNELRRTLGFGPCEPVPASELPPGIEAAGFGWRGRLRQQLAEFDIVVFIRARATELESSDPEGAVMCRRVIDDCCDHVDVTPGGYPPGSLYVLGPVNNLKALRRLARNWSDHPDYREEWNDD